MIKYTSIRLNESQFGNPQYQKMWDTIQPMLKNINVYLQGTVVILDKPEFFFDKEKIVFKFKYNQFKLPAGFDDIIDIHELPEVLPTFKHKIMKMLVSSGFKNVESARDGGIVVRMPDTDE